MSGGVGRLSSPSSTMVDIVFRGVTDNLLEGRAAGEGEESESLRQYVGGDDAIYFPEHLQLPVCLALRIFGSDTIALSLTTGAPKFVGNKLVPCPRY